MQNQEPNQDSVYDRITKKYSELGVRLQQSIATLVESAELTEREKSALYQKGHLSVHELLIQACREPSDEVEALINAGELRSLVRLYQEECVYH